MDKTILEALAVIGAAAVMIAGEWYIQTAQLESRRYISEFAIGRGTSEVAR